MESDTESDDSVPVKLSVKKKYFIWKPIAHVPRQARRSSKLEGRFQIPPKKILPANKGVPSRKAIKKKKFSEPQLVFPVKKESASEPDIIDEQEDLEELLQSMQDFAFNPVTPEMLVCILQSPHLIRSGASLAYIIKNLRASDHERLLNPHCSSLRAEVRGKLNCAVRLGIVTMNKAGRYNLDRGHRLAKLSKSEVNKFWKTYISRLINTYKLARPRTEHKWISF